MATDILATPPVTLTVERWFYHTRYQNEFNRPYRPETLSDIMIYKGALGVEEKHKLQDRMEHQERFDTRADPKISEHLLNMILAEDGLISDSEDNQKRSGRLYNEVGLYRDDQAEYEQIISLKPSRQGVGKKRKRALGHVLSEK